MSHRFSTNENNVYKTYSARPLTDSGISDTNIEDLSKCVMRGHFLGSEVFVTIYIVMQQLMTAS
jgi:hypothetical protein